MHLRKGRGRLGTRRGVYVSREGRGTGELRRFRVPWFRVRFRVAGSGSLAATDEDQELELGICDLERGTRNLPWVPRSTVPGTVQGFGFRFTGGDRTRTDTGNSNQEPSTWNEESRNFRSGSGFGGSEYGSGFRLQVHSRRQNQNQHPELEPGTFDPERGTAEPSFGFHVPRSRYGSGFRFRFTPDDRTRTGTGNLNREPSTRNQEPRNLPSGSGFRVPRFRVRFRVSGSGSLLTTEPEPAPAPALEPGTFDPEPGTSEP